MRNRTIPHLLCFRGSSYGLFINNRSGYCDGLQVTLKIFVITIVLSLPLGIIMAMARLSPLACFA